MTDNEIFQCKAITIPTGRKYKNTQFSTIKRRSGRESVPYLGLSAGVHYVRFYNDKRDVVLKIKTWLSPYGWAWKVLP